LNDVCHLCPPKRKRKAVSWRRADIDEPPPEHPGQYIGVCEQCEVKRAARIERREAEWARRQRRGRAA
jgi:hypothetical protein